MQQATTVSLQMGFSGPPEGNPISLNLIEIKEERVEGLGGFEPPTCGLGNPSYFTILLARLAFSCLLLAGFDWYSGVIVPKLFPSFRSVLSA